jgi:hypothetical protein
MRPVSVAAPVMVAAAARRGKGNGTKVPAALRSSFGPAPSLCRPGLRCWGPGRAAVSTCRSCSFCRCRGDNIRCSHRRVGVCRQPNPRYFAYRLIARYDNRATLAYQWLDRVFTTPTRSRSSNISGIRIGTLAWYVSLRHDDHRVPSAIRWRRTAQSTFLYECFVNHKSANSKRSWQHLESLIPLNIAVDAWV